MSKKMNAIVAIGYGSPEVLQFQEVNKPEPKANEVLVKVKTASATKADAMMRTGKPYFARLIIGLTKPKKGIPGTGFAGVVEEIGADVKNFKVGDRIFGETAFGFRANAEYLVVPEDGIVMQMPENLDFSEASSYADGHLTSYNFLKEVGKLKPGQKVLINGASGSLGTAAVQIAKHLGAHVTGVSSHRNAGLVKSLGADEVIDYQKTDFTKGSEEYDLVYDTIGKSSFKAAKGILKPNGQYLSPVLQFPLLMDMMITSIKGGKRAKFEATGANKPAKLKAMLAEVVEIFKAGKLKTVIDRQYPLEKVAEAHRYIDSGRKKGNVVIYNA